MTKYINNGDPEVVFYNGDERFSATPSSQEKWEETAFVRDQTLLSLVTELTELNDDNLAQAVLESNDVQWCLSELRDYLYHDMVEVVRCKDCKHYDMGVCLKIYSDGNVHVAAWQKRKPDDFCSYGERKDCGDAEG